MTVARRLRILRVRQAATLVSAQAYEDLFERQFAALFDLSFAPLVPWYDTVVGPPGAAIDVDAAAVRFATAVSDRDFLCPSYECIPLAPLLVALRNRARARTRLLLVAHSPGAYAFEWALLRPLLAPGDVVIAPSESGRNVIEYLVPALAPFVRVIPHPMARLPASAARASRPTVVTLGRIHARKLPHRLIEAMALLRARGARSLRLEIGGPLDDGGWIGPHPYTNTLREKIRRLALDDAVLFAGPVRGDAAKSAFLSRASAVINLSVTIEESFGKTPVEALGLGVPVVATDWDGLPETIGECGPLVPVKPSRDVMGGVDVDPADIADGVASALDAPAASERCIGWSERFTPAAVLPRYRAVLEEAAGASPRSGKAIDWPQRDVPAAPGAGLLAHAPPLGAFSWRELFEVYVTWCGALRRAWSGDTSMPVKDGARVRGAFLSGVEPMVKLFFASGSRPDARSSGTSPRRGSAPPMDVLDRLELAARDHGLMTGRAACVRELIDAGRLTAAAAALDMLEHEGLRPALAHFWRSELALASGDAPAALAHALVAASDPHLGEFDWRVVRLVARAARRAGSPVTALPVLLGWLERFPDSQESGPVWLEACVSSIGSGRAYAASAEGYWRRARALLGAMPAVEKCGALVARARERSTVMA